MEYILLIDKAVGLVMLLLNAIGAGAKVSAIVAARIAENREWTDEERQTIRDDLAANKAAAAAALGLPPPA